MTDANRFGAPRILVLRPGAIGDTLLTYPALLHLRARFPAVPVHLIGNPAATPILATQHRPDGAALLAGWTPFDHPAVTGLFVPNGPSEQARRAFAPIVAAVAWCADPEGGLEANLRRLGAERVVVAPSRPRPDAGIRVADHLLATLDRFDSHPNRDAARPNWLVSPEPAGPAGPSRASSYPPLKVAPGWSEDAEALLTRLGLAGRPFVLVHPGSGSPAKNWPAERFARVAASLPDTVGAAPILVAGPAEEGTVGRVSAAPGSPIPVLRDVPLTTVAAVIQRALTYLGNDSGLTHLAGLLGVPTVALFGPTDPVMWAPLGPHVWVLRRQPLDALNVNEVLIEVGRAARADDPR